MRASNFTDTIRTPGRLTTSECEVSKIFRGYDSSHLRKRLNLARLTLKSTKGIAHIEGPSLSVIGHDEKYYLFAKPAVLDDYDPGVDISVKAKFTYQTSQSLLSEGSASFAGHALSEFLHAAGEDTYRYAKP